MFPKLYNAVETDFMHNGLGLLSGTITAIATEELNGIFELKIEYDSDGFLADIIDKEMIVKAYANDKQDEQLFRIYSIEKNHENDNLIIDAVHITNDLANNFVEELKATSLTKRQVMEKIGSSTKEPHPFTVTSTNTTTQSSTSLYRTNPLQMIGGMEGSILQIWGGQIERDNFRLVMHDRRGHDDGVLVTYAKNLTGLEAIFDMSKVITAIYPFKYDEETDTLITVPGKYIYSPLYNNYAQKYIVPLDMSDDSITTPQQLLNVTQGFFNTESKDLPSLSMEINFVTLYDTEEYKDLKVLELVGMGDTITVRHSKFGIDVQANVNRIEYDCLTRRNIAVDVGAVKSNLTSKINGIADVADKVAGIENKAEQAIISANGKNKNYHGANEPATGQDGDLWFKEVDGEYTRTYRHDGIEWQLILDMDNKETKDLANTAKDRAEDAYAQSEQAITDAQRAFDRVQDAIDLIEGMDGGFEDILTDLQQAKQDAAAALAQAQAMLDDFETLSTDVESQLIVIAGQLTSKVSQIDFDALEGTVTSQGTAITQNTTDIALKADETYVDTINGIVDSHSAQINTNAYDIGLKANQTTVNTLTGRVTAAEGAIDVNAQQIALKVSEIDADNKYATQTSLTLTSNSLTGLINDLDGNVGLLQLASDSYATRITDAEGNITANTQLATGLQTRVEDAEGNITDVTQLATGLQTTVIDLGLANSTQFIQLSNAINLRVIKDDIINQINISTEEILISGNRLVLDGDTTVNGSFKVTDANILNLDAGKITFGTLDGLDLSAVNIYGSYIEGSTFFSGNANDFTQISNSALTARGKFNRTWQGTTTTHDIRTRLQNGHLRFRNDSLDRSLYYTEFGISTYVDGEGESGGSSGSILWWDTQHSPSSQKGITVNSWGGTAALVSDQHHALVKSRFSTTIESTESNILFTPYSNETTRGFRMTKTADRLQGYLLFGGQDDTSPGLRFSNSNDGIIQVVDSARVTGGTTAIEAGNGVFNRVIRRTGNSYLDLVSDQYFRVGDDSTQPRVASNVIYNRTGSADPNLYLTSAGTFTRSTSASKYKVNIDKQFKTDEEQLAHSKKILGLNISSWFDKNECEITANEIAQGKRLSEDNFKLDSYTGLIAEHVRDVGLNEHVVYGSDGDVEGIEYSRLWLHLIPVIKNLLKRIEVLENET